MSLSQTDQVQIGECCTAEWKGWVYLLTQHVYLPQRWTPAAMQRATGSRRMQSTSRVNRTRRRVLRRQKPGERTDGSSLTTLPPAVLDISGTLVPVYTLFFFRNNQLVNNNLCTVSGVWENEASVLFKENKGWGILQLQTDGVTTCTQITQAARKLRLMVIELSWFEWFHHIYGLLSHFSCKSKRIVHSFFPPS